MYIDVSPTLVSVSDDGTAKSHTFIEINERKRKKKKCLFK